MENTQYKGFAYTKNENIKPTVLYGETPDDILKKLNAYNVARTQEYKFQTCNIGSLNAETSKYENYHKYEVSTGKEIPPIYLEIPPLPQDKFQKVVADLNAAGAKFNPNKKQWYITADQDWPKFRDICSQFSSKSDMRDLLAKIESDMEEHSQKQPFMIEGLEIQYAVKMDNQQTVILSESDLNLLQIKLPDKFLDTLNEKALEQLQQMSVLERDPEQLARESEYTISVSKDAYDNRCTIWYNDGREPLELRGDAYGIHFPTMSASEAADFVSEYMKNMEQPDRNNRPEYREGDAIDCYVPLRLNVDPNQPIYVENVSHVVGNVRSIGNLANTEAKIYEILQEGGNVRTIRSDEIYAHDQARVLLRAAADELTGIQFDLLADRNLSAAQMEEIRFGFKDGLSAEQVALYANPNMTPAEMDMCRIGLNSGLGYAEISKLLKETKELSWTDSRNRLNEAIKGHRVIHENFLSESADFYGIQVPVENGKRVISQETMDGLLKHIAEKGIESEPLDFKNCIFRGINFPDNAYCAESFQNTDFSGSEFYHCRFHADMRWSRFRDTSFTETSFKEALLNHCDFTKSRIANCNFQYLSMVEVNFSEASMKQTKFYACEMENNDFYKTQMDTVDVSDSCGIADSKHFDTISTENMSDRVLWRLSGVSEVSYERKEELQELFWNEKEGSLVSENENWRLDLSRDEEELVDKWDKQQTQAMEEKSSDTKSGQQKNDQHTQSGRKRSVVGLLHEKNYLVSASSAKVAQTHEDRFKKAEALAK